MDWILFLSVFGILFLGELGDKTQIIVFNLSLEHEKSYKVAIGATLGFASIVTLGLFIGGIITAFVPIELITTLSGIIFIIIGVIGTRELKKLYNDRKEQKEENLIREEVDLEVYVDENSSVSRLAKFRKNPYLASFGLLFMMELGDKSQILTITLASFYPNPLEIWLGSFLALSGLAWIGAYFGDFISRKVPKFHLKIVSIVIFVFVGIITLISAL